MYSSLIGKIEKAIRYEREPGRMHFQSLQMDFRGEHDTYTLTLNDGNWSCTCHTFASGITCSHTMAAQRVLNDMLDQESRTEHVELLQDRTPVLN